MLNSTFVSMDFCFFMVPLLLQLLVHRVKGYLESRLWRVPISSSNAFVFSVPVLSFEELVINMSMCARMTYHKYFRSFKLILVWNSVQRSVGSPSLLSLSWRWCWFHTKPWRRRTFFLQLNVIVLSRMFAAVQCVSYRCADVNTWSQMKWRNWLQMRVNVSSCI